MRFRINLAYDGAGFCGWQIQPHKQTVQETLEKALEVLLRKRVQVTGAGRTDTGVSASYYVAHFDFDGSVPQPLHAPGSESSSSVDCSQLRYKLNAILPKSVSIISVEPAAPDFHARFNAVRRQYTYYLHRTKDPFCDGCSYYYAYPDVDFSAMNRAADHLLGTHDFSCFEKSGGDNKTSICNVFCARWEPYEPAIRTAPSGKPALNPDGGPHYWRFTIEADRFLRNMVRAIVGTLLEVGRGRRSIEDFSALVLPPDAPDSNESRRCDAGESVPGHALFLSKIDY